jgi:hypothetical protein
MSNSYVNSILLHTAPAYYGACSCVFVVSEFFFLTFVSTISLPFSVIFILRLHHPLIPLLSHAAYQYFKQYNAATSSSLIQFTFQILLSFSSFPFPHLSFFPFQYICYVTVTYIIVPLLQYYIFLSHTSHSLNTSPAYLPRLIPT